MQRSDWSVGRRDPQKKGSGACAHLSGAQALYLLAGFLLL